MKRIRNLIAASPRRFHSHARAHRASLIIGLELFALLLLTCAWAYRGGLLPFLGGNQNTGQASVSSGSQDGSSIRWVDFDVTAEAMTQAFRCDVATCQQEIHLNWIDLLACLGAAYGGDFSLYQPEDLDQLANRLKSGIPLEEITAKLAQYPYYREAYGAVLDGMVGLYEIEIPRSEAPDFALSDAQLLEGDPAARESGSQASEDGAKVWVTKYGLKAFHPLAAGFSYTHFDDFGTSRSYGYERRHLGHDMMGQTGTPVIAVESGRVEAIGWNQYGGWRLGIRSLDGKRYYYYAHLRKDYPYRKDLQEGSIVTAGDVIGYMGRTGYSATENTNNIDDPHLHFGLQLIFDESRKDEEPEIWINCYELIQFLSVNRSEAVKKEDTGEWERVYQMRDPVLSGV